MGISGVASFPVQSVVSLIFFQLFWCRKLGLNRDFSYFLVAGMFFILGGVWMPPHLYAPYICTHPHMPPYSSVGLYVLRGFACCGGL